MQDFGCTEQVVTSGLVDCTVSASPFVSGSENVVASELSVFTHCFTPRSNSIAKTVDCSYAPQLASDNNYPLLIMQTGTDY